MASIGDAEMCMLKVTHQGHHRYDIVTNLGAAWQFNVSSMITNTNKICIVPLYKIGQER